MSVEGYRSRGSPKKIRILVDCIKDDKKEVSEEEYIIFRPHWDKGRKKMMISNFIDNISIDIPSPDSTIRIL